MTLDFFPSHSAIIRSIGIQDLCKLYYGTEIRINSENLISPAVSCISEALLMARGVLQLSLHSREPETKVDM
jgi:hypothetical protein